MTRASVSANHSSRRAFLRTSSAAVAATTLPRSIAAAWGASSSESALWVTTTEKTPWRTRSFRDAGWLWDTLDLNVQSGPVGPPMEGFGACFNELGWTSLQLLSAADQDSIFQEMFAPGRGANFTLCRMPIGANDFARNWYSYDETPGDFALKNFSIANDRETLLPFIQKAQRYNPQLCLWASPWSPPSWMKTNGHYAEAQQSPDRPPNGLRPDQVGHEGSDVFIQEERYLAAYAAYFGKFIDAYRQNGIVVGMVMPQNEFNSAQAFPSCTWTPEGLSRFIEHLGPAMQVRDVQIFFGTLERGNPELLNRTLADKAAARWIKGVGVQWAGKNALEAIHEQHPQLKLYSTEQECGDGQNTWSYAGYCWRLMKHYLEDGASAYMYWNLSLKKGGLSRWGWPQNSLVTVDEQSGTYHFNHEYYFLKHASHFVQNGARRLAINGTCDDALAFRNLDGSYVVIVRNESPQPHPLDISIAGRKVSVALEPDSISTLHLPSVDS